MALTQVSSALLNDEAQAQGFRNRIINGEMRIAQRGTSSSAGGYGPVDRFSTSGDNLDELQVLKTQAADGPDGFTTSLKLDVTTAESAVATNERYFISYAIEAQDLQDLQYGTAGAKQITLSFWVKTNLTGTYSVRLYEADGGPRVIGSTYTVDSANTWEKKVLTFAGDVDGTINNDNGTGLSISWTLMAGSDYTSTDNTTWGANATGKTAYGQTVNWGLSTSDDFYLTGVQLEVGSVATEFERRPYGAELALCQRYYQITTKTGQAVMASGRGGASGTRCHFVLPLSTAMRTTPTPPAAMTFYVYRASAVTSTGTISITVSYYDPTNSSIGCYIDATCDDDRVLCIGNNGATVAFSAEL